MADGIKIVFPLANRLIAFNNSLYGTFTNDFQYWYIDIVIFFHAPLQFTYLNTVKHKGV